MTSWKCSNCGSIVEADIPPEQCPNCGQKCEFINATCYVPECGGEGNIDPRVG